jgi:hypothetical protein
MAEVGTVKGQGPGDIAKRRRGGCGQRVCECRGIGAEGPLGLAAEKKRHCIPQRVWGG